MGRFDLHKDIAIRTLGVAMFSFPVGMGVGAVISNDWIKGGAIAFTSSILIAISGMGVILAWRGRITQHDVQEAFRTATAKAGEDNELVQEFIEDTKRKK
jgi:hypothetical protein